MSAIEQRTITRAWAANVALPIQLEFDRDVRILRVFMAFSDGGTAGIWPALRQVQALNGADYVHGEWVSSNDIGDAAVPSGVVGYVTFSTAAHKCVANPSFGSHHVPIPPDLVILKGQRLDIWAFGATAPGAGATVASGPVVLTYLALPS